MIQTAAISSLAYVFAESLHSMIALPPVFALLGDFNIGGIFYPFTNLNVKLIAILLIILLTWVNAKGIKVGAGVSTAVLLLVFAVFF